MSDGDVSAVENRASERTRLWLAIRLRSEDGDALAVTYDVSDGGVLLLAAKDLAVDAKVVLTFDLPDGREGEPPVRVKAAGRVVHAAKNQADPDGIWPFKLGVALDEFPVELLRALDVLRQPGSLPPPPDSRRP